MQSNDIKKSHTITLSIIVKNEEKYLRGCLESVKDVVSEIVLVDTGSTDDTIKIAEEFGAKIFHFDWINDFSAARNYALSKSKGDWILYLDADERLSGKSIEELKKLTHNYNSAGFYCSVKSAGNSSGSSSMMKYTRLFKNIPGLKFSGKVHEQIEDSLIEKGCRLIDSNIEIIHLGYDVEQEKIIEKAKRNLNLLLSEFESHPTGYNAFQLGQTFNIIGNIDEANQYFKLAIKDEYLEIHHRAQAYRQLAAFELKNKNYKTAEVFVDKGLALVPESPLLNIVKANLLLETGDDEQSVNFCKIAYENNKKFLRGEKNSKFEQTVIEKNMLLYGINLSIAANNKELFEYFYPKIMQQSIPVEDKRIIDFYKKILFDEIITEKEVQKILKLSGKIDFNILLKNLLNYKLLKSKVTIIEYLIKVAVADDALRNKIYSVYYSKESEYSLSYLETAYENNPQNLEIGFCLMNCYLYRNKINELNGFINKAIKSYSAHPEIIEKFKSIRNKISSLNQ